MCSSDLYGYLFGGYIVGLAVGQYTVGALSDIAHNYSLSVYAVEAAAIVSLLLVFTLGPYRFRPRDDA